MKQDVKRAVVLLSGGLDSATALAMAKDQGYDCYVLSFDYGQRSLTELNAARAIAAQLGVVEHRVLRLHLEDFGGSALTDTSIEVPEGESEGVPVTYVPARNTVFLSLALGWAEVLDADAIFIGVNAVDYSGYPDCRPEFIAAFETMANLATRRGISGNPIHIKTPLMDLTKADIIRRGVALGIDYGLTLSCYQADDDGRACGRCDSCRLRANGFADAGVKDPTRYV
ncbi:7-cyano-7-deazaguanine synthase QueC [Marinobacterium sediminicola]|uniref:7-cyano-7-deazaguanine synthase n=1 Tax=Marinobacterium sediminicola TaxID=518898 RepID=A0ABY1RX06_9GAMM|nr:7-cyano-7-deazaguanine synthase QueC [Marinobacterium sediminicola]ULG67891.1 7-cyano-7-deazaguanine synthase QueC [Marinobacterium sediminicola]SMR71404.1 preQ(0) biosynthesis protein QueC [Marinobacterium sediminicola]